MAQSKVRVACIGCGRIAQDHLHAYSTLDDVDIIGVVDTQPTVADSVAAQFECQAYPTPEALLSAQEVDAVTICTPPSTHCALVSIFLDHGVHVLCEKPLALTVEEAKLMEKKAADARVAFMMATKFRFVNDVVKAKGILESGTLGRMLFFENTFCSYVNMSTRWNANPAISGGGVLIDNGTHSVDLARFLLGDIDSVQATRGPQIQDIPVEDTVRLFFQTNAEVLGTVDLSWSLHKAVDDYVTIHGTEGTLSIGWKRSGYYVRNQQSWIHFGDGYNKRDAFVKQQRHFIDCLLGKSQSMINTIDGIRSVEVISAAYRSMEEHRWIKVTA